MVHMLRGDNLSLALPRQVPGAEASGALVSAGLSGHKVFSAYNINTVFPLYVYPEVTDQTSTVAQAVQPNLDSKLVGQLAERVGLTYTFRSEALFAHGTAEELSPVDVLDYCYAVLHSPAYRVRYREFLKNNFPRIPLPVDANKFRALVQLGAELRALNLLEWHGIDAYITSYPVGGSNEVTRKISANSPGWEPTSEDLGRVKINDTQYFRPRTGGGLELLYRRLPARSEMAEGPPRPCSYLRGYSALPTDDRSAQAD